MISRYKQLLNAQLFSEENLFTGIIRAWYRTWYHNRRESVEFIPLFV